MIRKKYAAWMLAVFILCMGISMTVNIMKSKGTLRNSYENDSRTVSIMISNVIENNFLRPIAVTDTLAKDITTKKIVDIHSEKEAYAMEADAKEYLTSIRDGFGYSVVYIVSDSGKAYFTCNGISKFLDLGNDPADEWYENFLASDVTYSLDVDTDEAANWSLSVFVNEAIYDDSKNLIGVCGVGIDMTEIQSLLSRYERIYNVKIDLINKDGLIQVDSDIDRIEKDYIEIDNLGYYADGECYYEMLDEGSRTITYLKDLDWYLVVQNNNTLAEKVNGIMLPSILCATIGILLSVVFLVVGSREEENE